MCGAVVGGRIAMTPLALGACLNQLFRSVRVVVWFLTGASTNDRGQRANILLPMPRSDGQQ
jgi:hypothetical protein